MKTFYFTIVFGCSLFLLTSCGDTKSGFLFNVTDLQTYNTASNEERLEKAYDISVISEDSNSNHFAQLAEAPVSQMWLSEDVNYYKSCQNNNCSGDYKYIIGSDLSYYQGVISGVGVGSSQTDQIYCLRLFVRPLNSDGSLGSEYSISKGSNCSLDNPRLNWFANYTDNEILTAIQFRSKDSLPITYLKVWSRSITNNKTQGFFRDIEYLEIVGEETNSTIEINPSDYFNGEYVITGIAVESDFSNNNNVLEMETKANTYTLN